MIARWKMLGGVWRRLVAACLSASVCAVGLNACQTPPPAAPTAVTAVGPPPTQRAARVGSLEINSARIHYWDTGGDGAAIILLHAATGNAESWVYQQPVFADAGYRVIGYSRRGHTPSVVDVAAPQSAHSDDLAVLMNALSIEKAHIVGTAAGAIVAADFALSHPERVDRLVLASSLVSFQDPLVANARQLLELDAVRQLSPHVLELSASYRFANPEGTTRWAAIEARAHQAGAPTPRSANTVTFEALAETRLPILLIGGDADLYLPPPLLREIATRLPTSRTVFIPGAAHSVFWEQPAAFNDAVLRFLAN